MPSSKMFDLWREREIKALSSQKFLLIRQVQEPSSRCRHCLPTTSLKHRPSPLLTSRYQFGSICSCLHYDKETVAAAAFFFFSSSSGRSFQDSPVFLACSWQSNLLLTAIFEWYIRQSAWLERSPQKNLGLLVSVLPVKTMVPLFSQFVRKM